MAFVRSKPSSKAALQPCYVRRSPASYVGAASVANIYAAYLSFFWYYSFLLSEPIE